jgi:hypothetical protein
MHDIVHCDSRLVESSRFEQVRPWLSAEGLERYLVPSWPWQPSLGREFALEHEPKKERSLGPWRP